MRAAGKGVAVGAGVLVGGGIGLAVAGAWLASRGGGRRWVMQTAGRDSVVVTVGESTERRWKELWLSGPVLRIGAIEPDTTLWSVG